MADAPGQDILILMPTVQGGGAEKVILRLLQSPVAREHRWTVLAGQKPTFAWPEEVRFLKGPMRLRQSLLHIWDLLRREQFDTVFMTHWYYSLGLLLLVKPLVKQNTRWIIRESSLRSLRLPRGWRGRLLKFMMTRAYLRADLIIAQSRFMMADLVDNFGLPEEKICLVPNPMNGDTLLEAARASTDLSWPLGNNATRLIAVGRLERVKGFHLLLETMTALPDSFQLMILGEGSERTNLEQTIARHDLGKRVVLAGHLANPHPLVHQADLFLITSEVEGFPNAALEALFLGTPVLAMEAPGGTRELPGLAPMVPRNPLQLAARINEFVQSPTPVQGDFTPYTESAPVLIRILAGEDMP